MLFSASVAKPDKEAVSTGRNTPMLPPVYAVGGVFTTGGGGVDRGSDEDGGGGGGFFSHAEPKSKMIIGISSSFFMNKIFKQFYFRLTYV